MSAPRFRYEKGPFKLDELDGMVRAAGYHDREVGTILSKASSYYTGSNLAEAGIVLFNKQRSKTYVLVSGVRLRNSWWTRNWTHRDPLVLINSSLEGALAIDDALNARTDHSFNIEYDLKDVFRSKLPAWLKAGVVLNKT